MAELSSPLQIAGLLETKCSSDPNIYSIYSFETTDMGGSAYVGFAVFYSPANDMDSGHLKNVRLLWEKRAITSDGIKFLKENWELVGLTEYKNNKGDVIPVKFAPIGKDGRIIREEMPKASHLQGNSIPLEPVLPSPAAKTVPLALGRVFSSIPPWIIIFVALFLGALVVVFLTPTR